MHIADSPVHMSFEENIRDYEHHKIFRAEGNLNMLNVAELKKEIFKFLEGESGKSLVIDLEKVSLIDSTAIGVFVAAHKKATDSNGHFGLLNVSSSIHNMMAAAQLGRVLNIYETEADLMK